MGNTHQQMTLFGVPSIKEGEFNIYHDESCVDPDHIPFQLHGVLFIPTTKIQTTYSFLQYLRGDYRGRIHFKLLKDNTSSKKPDVARAWMRYFYNELMNYAFYKCLVIDMRSPKFDKALLAQPYRLYNRSAAMAMHSGLAWFLKEYQKITVNIFSEEKSRPSFDNFDTYIPSSLLNRAQRKKNNRELIIPNRKVTIVNGDPKKVDDQFAIHCEFIQLTDLITASINEAINAKASREIKLELGRVVGGWITDIGLPPWEQKDNLHRRFSLSTTANNKDFTELSLNIFSQKVGFTRFNGHN